MPRGVGVCGVVCVCVWCVGVSGVWCGCVCGMCVWFVGEEGIVRRNAGEIVKSQAQAKNTFDGVIVVILVPTVLITNPPHIISPVTTPQQHTTRIQ